MTFKKYQTANNVKAQLDVGISASITSLIVKSGFGALYPTHNGTTDKNYLGTVVKFDTDGKTILKEEIVEVTARVGDTFSIIRSAGTCPGSDASTTQGTTAYSFDAGDYFFLNNTAELIKDIQDEITSYEASNDASVALKLSKAEYQAGTYVYGASSGGTDDYALTLPLSPGAYALGQVFRFLADVANTGPATLNVNGLGAIAIKKLHDQDLETGDIEANQIVVVAYDGTNFQMNSQISQIAEAETSKLTEQIITAGQDGSAGDCLFKESMVTFAVSTVVQNIGDITGSTRVSIKAIGSGVAGNQLKLSLKKTGTPTGSLTIRIETNNAGSPSGILIDPNATATIAHGSLTTSLADTTATLAGSITIPKGTVVWIVIAQGSDIVDGSNYYGIGYSANNTLCRAGKLYNGSSRVETGTSVVDDDNITYNGSDNVRSEKCGYRLTAQYDLYITSAKQVLGCGATHGYLKQANGTLIQEVALVADVATFTPYFVASGTSVRVEFGVPSGYYNNRTYLNSPSGTQVRTNITINSASINGADDSLCANFESITTYRTLGAFQGGFPYASSGLFIDILLGKTDADLLYKIPTDYLRIARENFTAGSIPKVTIPGSVTNAVPGLTANTDLFLSGTPGGVSTTPGTNRYFVGKVLPDGINLRQASKSLATGTQTPGTSPYTYQNTTGFPVIITITGGTVSAIAISRNGTNFFQVGSATNNQVVLQPMDYVRVTYSSAPAMTIFYQ